MQEHNIHHLPAHLHNGHSCQPQYTETPYHSSSYMSSNSRNTTTPLHYTPSSHLSTHINSPPSTSLPSSPQQSTPQYQYQYQYQPHHYHQADWYAVPRTWTSFNPSLCSPPHASSAPIAASPDYTIINQLQPQPTSWLATTPHAGGPASAPTPTPSGAAASLPQLTLTRSTLQQLNAHAAHAPTTGMVTWMRKGQREGPWDGVGYVRLEDNVEVEDEDKEGKEEEVEGYEGGYAG